MNRLKDLREDKELLQKDIADYLNINRRTYIEYELENNLISVKYLCKLADYYNVSIDYIVYNTDDRKAHKKSPNYNNNRLLELRKNHNLTQKELAKSINMSQTGYSEYEIGKRKIPITILIRLSDFYNTSIDYILGITDDQSKYKKSIMM